MKPANFHVLNEKMCVQSWNAVMSADDVDDKVDIFNKTVLKMLNEAMPEKTVRIHSSDKPWMTTQIKIQIKARQRAFSLGDKSTYKSLCEHVSNLITKAKLNYYCNKAKDFRISNPHKWYKSIYALAGAQEGTTNSTSYASDDDLLRMAEQLQGAFTKPWKDLTADDLCIDEVEHLLKDNTPPVPSLGQVRSCLSNLNTKKATGADKIPAWFLHRYCDAVTPAVHSIITSSIIQCKYPTVYKHALISPVPKIPSPIDLENDFRQISILPQIAKILERLQLQLNRHNLKISNNQHAFTKDRSTVSALLSISQNWFNATDNTSNGSKGVHIVFEDFRKAFDLVDHGILLRKLAAMNINKAFWLWIKSFLSGRTQQINLRGIQSSIATCPAGVPQGSVISPTLFNVHIDDLEETIPHQLEISTCKYADDCTQDEVVNEGSQSHLQEVIDAVDNWTSNNKMTLNAKKTKDMWISFTSKILEPPLLNIGDTEIERVEHFKLLGVWFQNDLKWNTHVSKTVQKANKRLYYLRECRKSHLPTDVGLTTYLTKIRPLLEYASPVWGGIPSYLEEEIERIQNRSLKILGLDSNILETLRKRRNDATIKELNKICKDPENPSNRFLSVASNEYYVFRNGKAKCIPKEISRTLRHKRSFIPRACDLAKTYNF